MKKMNKSYILTALGVVGSSLLNAPASADLFKCVACTNKPANSSYTSAGNGGNNCSWTCNSGYSKNGSLCCANKPADSSYSTNSCSWTCNSNTVKNNNLCCKVSGDHYTFESSNSCNIKCDFGYSSNGSGGATSGAISKCQKDYFMVELAGYLCDTRIKVEQKRFSVNGGSNGTLYCYPATISGGELFDIYKVTNTVGTAGLKNPKRTISWTYNGKTYSKQFSSASISTNYCTVVKRETSNSNSVWAGNVYYPDSTAGYSVTEYYAICNDKLLKFDKNKNFVGELEL